MPSAAGNLEPQQRAHFGALFSFSQLLGAGRASRYPRQPSALSTQQKNIVFPLTGKYQFFFCVSPASRNCKLHCPLAVPCCPNFSLAEQ